MTAADMFVTWWPRILLLMVLAATWASGVAVGLWLAAEHNLRNRPGGVWHTHDGRHRCQCNQTTERKEAA